MRVALDIAGVFVLLMTLVSGCYATTGTPGPTCSQDPNGPGCYGGLHDDKKPIKKTCYRMTMGCDDIQWEPPDEHGNSKGKCIPSDSTPHEIPCADVSKP